MLGSEQLDRLKEWLLKSSSRVKFLTTPAIFATLRRAGMIAGESEGCGKYYQRERDDILNFVSEHNIPGVIILSGDVHWAAVFSTELPNGAKVWEFSVSPIQSIPLPSGYLTNIDNQTVEFVSHGWLHFATIDVKTTAATVPAKTADAVPDWAHHASDDIDTLEPHVTFRLYRYLPYVAPTPVLTFEKTVLV